LLLLPVLFILSNIVYFPVCGPLQVIPETGGVFLKEVRNHGKTKILSSNESARERNLAYAG
jgi:hypothetical protein